MSKRSKARHVSERRAIAVSAPTANHQLPATAGKSHGVITGMCASVLERIPTMLTVFGFAGIAAAGSQVPVIIHSAAPTEIEAMLQQQPQGRVVAVYQAPWDAVLSANGDFSDWLRYHSGLLRLRQRCGERLQLVNAKRLDDSAPSLLEMIAGLPVNSKVLDGEARPAFAAIDAQAVLRAKCFEWMAPEYWDVYEALESCAWLGQGEPEYRDCLPPIDSSALPEVAAAWQGALTLPIKLAQTQQQLSTQSEHVASIEAELFEARAQALRVEESATLREQELSARLRAQADAARTAEQALREKLRTAEEQARESRSESDMLLAQLQQIQESLESSFIQGRDAARQAAEAIDRLEQEKASAKEESAKKAALVDKLKAETTSLEKQQATILTEKSKLAAEVAQLKDALSKATAKLKVTEAELQQRGQTALALEKRAKDADVEASLLLQQLHHVQEELEHYFVRSQRVTEALKKSTDSFHRARGLVAKLMKVQPV